MQLLLILLQLCKCFLLFGAGPLALLQHKLIEFLLFLGIQLIDVGLLLVFVGRFLVGNELVQRFLVLQL